MFVAYLEFSSFIRYEEGTTGRRYGVLSSDSGKGQDLRSAKIASCDL